MKPLYFGSRGPRPIADMASEHIESAVAKLQREEPHRTVEISDLQAELARRASERR